ncbi:alpha/beta hydrolase [Microcella sp.]|uniref:alpha/beta hydrolase n=1 Tax=Microcella sp. TaxID=1913979 RepID=UPI003F719728
MLFDATAVLIASLTVATVAGPPVALENVPATPVSIITTPAEMRDLDLPTSTQQGAAASAPAIPRSASSIATLTGASLLHALTAMPPTAVTEFVESNPRRLHELLAAPPGAPQVSGWWAGLDLRAQRSMLTSVPELVGNLDGIPIAVRNEANRDVLRSTIRELELEGSLDGRALATQNLQRLQMLYAIADALGPATANPPRTLLQLDTHDAGKVAIVLGDLETADYVSYLMPGMFITVGGNVVEWTDTAARLYDEQVSWLSLLAEAGATDEVETVATVAWIGYQTPHLLNVGSLDLAYEGRDAIASAIDGLQTIRGTDQPFISLLAHSYGSTAAMLALEESTTVDALAMIGSPGAPASSVDELNVRGDVFVGEASWDPIPNSSFFGSDPGAAEFGARIMSVAGTVDVITNRVLAASTGHNEYWSPGTESMRNLALIGINKGELVTDGSQRDAGRTLALLL